MRYVKGARRNRTGPSGLLVATAVATATAVSAPLAMTACSPSRAIEAARLMEDVAAGGGPSRLKQSRPAPTREPVVFRADGKVRRGDLYRPGDGARAMLVLVPGIARAGKDDRRLIQFAESLARARFRVLVPDIENMRALKVSASDAGEIAAAVRHLAAASRSGKGTVGVVAISYAAGPAILAAMRRDTRDRVRFVLAIGGYYDIESVVTFAITGYYRNPSTGAWRYLRPNDYGKWVFVKGNADRVTDPVDRAALAEMAARKLRDPAAGIADQVARLRADGRAVHALLVNDRPEKVPGLIAALPAAVRREMRALDLKGRDLSTLAARLILVHGRDDAIIPVGESVALAAAMPAGRADLFVADSLQHVDVGDAGFLDTLTLWQAAYRLLEERDRMAPPDAP